MTVSKIIIINAGEHLILFFIVITIFILNSCNNAEEIKNDNILTLHPNEAMDEVNLSLFADSVIYIKLESDSANILGRIHTVIIKEKYIYISDISQQSIFIFDKNGMFVKRLNKLGKGPDEYPRLGFFTVDDQEEYLELYTFSGKGKALYIYSINSFELIRKVKMPLINASSIRKYGGYYYFATNQAENTINEEKTNAGLLIVKNGQIVKALFNKQVESNGHRFSPFVECFTETNTGDIYITMPYDQTFYKIRDTIIHPFMTVDFDKFGIDNNYVGKLSTKDQLQYLLNLEDKAHFPVLSLNNSNIMLFSYYYNKGLYYYLELKDLNLKIHTKRIFNDLTGFPLDVELSSYSRMIAHEAWHENFLVDIITPSNFLKDETEKYVEGFGRITINDNPVIILIKIKGTYKVGSILE
ncbi:MAG: 6-bladed beta-propeller [Candidatus Paceibacterota bacterium]